MAFLISSGRFITAKNGKFVTSVRPCIEYVSGGTATGVAVGFVGDTREAQYRQELADTFTAEQLANSKIIELSGKTTGTVKLKITLGLTDRDAPLKLLLRKSDGTWTTLYDGYVPSGGILTVTVSEYGPVIGVTDDYLLTSDGSVEFDTVDNLLNAKKENF